MEGIPLRKLLGQIRLACEKYNMIEDGDIIGVGVSGGKDSLALLAGLHELQRFYPKSFRLIALMADPCFHKVPTDTSSLENLCKEWDIPLVVKRTDLYEIIFEIRKESNPCSMCAKMRRGILHDIAKEAGCNKVALGHTRDDAVETFYMNLFSCGRLGCFQPVTYLSRKDITMIRPLLYAEEKDTVRVCDKLELPVIKSNCPADGNTNREEMKQLIATLNRTYSGLAVKTIGAIERRNLDGWFEKEAPKGE
jgi:tRNA(Ile)-lysidine synthase TilS/MesJ